MKPLSPSAAAGLASGVYDVRQTKIEDLLQEGALDRGMNIISPLATNGFKGSSGAGPIKQISQFGYVAEGSGNRKGEIFVVTRGTATLFDGITDGNVGYQHGPSGHVVHAGFNKTWKSFREEMMAFLRGRNPSAIHCVGHSLGGALAFLNADHFSSIGAGKVYVYTFGSPRVGMHGFSDALTKRVGADNIFRVSHSADPVAMVPLFPFLHAPTAGNRYEISNGGGVIRASAHSIDLSYRAGIGQMSWSNLAGLYDHDRKLAAQSVEDRLKALEQHIGPAMYSVKFFRAIMRGLAAVMKAIGTAGLVTTQAALSGGFTVMDQIAEMLAVGSQISKDMSRHIETLVSAIFRFIGRAAVTTVKITITFLRWVLNLLLQTIVMLAQTALHM